MIFTIPHSTNFSHITIPVKATQAQPESKKTEEMPPIGISIPQAAKLIGVHKDTFLFLVREGKIRTVKVRKRVIVSVQSLREFIDGKKEDEPCDSGNE
jgi:excisionase family DNA binding protein